MDITTNLEWNRSGTAAEIRRVESESMMISEQMDAIFAEDTLLFTKVYLISSELRHVGVA